MGDIFAINDVAGYLSDEGIASYLYMMDAGPWRVKTGVNIKGAVMATRCNPINFIYNDIRTWPMLEDVHIPGRFAGVEGGPSAACRAPHLFLRMGYKGIAFFGCDSSFFDMTHLSGARPEATDYVLVVRVGGIDYVTNAAMLIQAKWLSKTIARHPNYLYNCSDGLLKAMIENPGDWDVVAVGSDLKESYAREGYDIWTKPYRQKGEKVWRPNV